MSEDPFLDLQIVRRRGTYFKNSRTAHRTFSSTNGCYGVYVCPHDGRECVYALKFLVLCLRASAQVANPMNKSRSSYRRQDPKGRTDFETNGVYLAFSP